MLLAHGHRVTGSSRSYRSTGDTAETVKPVKPVPPYLAVAEDLFRGAMAGEIAAQASAHQRVVKCIARLPASTPCRVQGSEGHRVKPLHRCNVCRACADVTGLAG